MLKTGVTNFLYYLISSTLLVLKEMRVDPDQNFTVKNPVNSNSALAKKRRNKPGAPGVGGIPSTITEQMSTE